MGYGSRALQLLQMYYEGRFPCLEEKVLEASQEIRTVSSEVSVCWPLPVLGLGGLSVGLELHRALGRALSSCPLGRQLFSPA